jgi:fructuronate reductase
LSLTDRSPSPRLSAANQKTALAYNRSQVTPGIVHLGIGAFHRAHMAVYIDDILTDDPGWGIVGASLKRPDTRQALAPQDFLYTLALRSGFGTSTRVIGSVLDVLDSNRQRDELIGKMADAQIRIVSLTVTEKGYCHDPATGTLDERHPDIVHDLARPAAPVSAPGLIVRALELRRATGISPFTVLCCDNLPANGETTKRIVTQFAALRGEGLADYIEREVPFPSTMVDRIVPATTDDDRKSIFERTGFWDAWPIITEPFTQWVIEDTFPFGRPALETAGAQFATDVQPFETMKLRMLNGSHSTIAYLGYLAGYEYVNQAIAEPAFRILIYDLMTEEVMETLPPDIGDLASYRDALLERFANPALQHRTWQIAMDGSQKLPQRLLGTIRNRLARNLPVTRAALGVAAWMRYVTGRDEYGRDIDVNDPLAAQLRAIADAARNVPERLVDGMLHVREIFGDDLPANQMFRSELIKQLSSLIGNGTLATVCEISRM